MDAEAVLLVDHRKRQVLERHVLLEQRVGADDDVEVARRQRRHDGVAGAALLAAGQQRDAQARGLGEAGDGGEMLAGEDFGRRHQRRLPARFDHLGHGDQSHHRLAGADIALKEADHAG